MCGITGIFAFNQIGRLNMINLSKAIDAISSRGPDQRGTFHDDFVGLGHRRLSILDTSAAGNQPMVDPTGRYRLIFNGEIYNYRDLKNQLISKGVQFKSTSDTEVLLRLLILEGTVCLQKLNGFFAFAFYDSQEQTVLIARDRFGIKPLHVYQDDDKVIFASELKSILAYGIDKELDLETLTQYLQLNYVAAPNSMIKNVQKLMPGTFGIISKEKIAKGRYYNLDEIELGTSALSYDQQLQRMRDLLEDSVRMRLVSDVPLGSFLSGGIDSSIIAMLAARHKPNLNTFSVGYRDEPYFDETNYANLVAKHIGSEHTVFKLSNQDLYEHVHSILDYIDEPFADSSAIAVFILSRETRKHSTVALSGDGADEMFGGYNKHAAAMRAFQTGSTEKFVSGMAPIWRALPKSRGGFLSNAFRQFDRFAQAYKLDPKDRYWQWAGFVNQTQALQLMDHELSERVIEEELAARKSDILRSINPSGSNLNEYLKTDMSLVLPNDMLTKVDLMSMANGLEVRVPFLDHRLVEFAMSLPVDSKIKGATRKRVLQDAFREMLPKKLYRRPKRGFEVPLLKWFRREMKSLIMDDLLEEDFVYEQGIFNVREVNLLKKKLFSSNPEDVHARIWGLIVFQWWWKKHLS